MKNNDNERSRRTSESKGPARDGVIVVSASIRRIWGYVLWPAMRAIGRFIAGLLLVLWERVLVRGWQRVLRGGFLREMLIFLGLNTDADPDEHRASRGFLHPPLRGQATLLLLSFVLAYLLYTGAVRLCYRSAWFAYSTGNAMDAILEEMPRVYEPRSPLQSRPRQRAGAFIQTDAPTKSSSALTDQEQASLLLLYLQELDIFDDDRNLADVEKEPLFKLLSGALIADDKHPFHQRPTVDIVVDIITATGVHAPSWYEGAVDSDNRKGSAAKFKRELADVLTAMLADFPGIPEKFADFQTITSADNMSLQREWYQLVAACDVDYGLSFGSWHWFRLNITGTNASVAEILHLLFKQANFASVASLDDARSVMAPTTRPPEGSPSAQATDSPNQIAHALVREDVKKLERFLSKLLSRAQSLDSVKNASLQMAVVRGYEQFALLVTFWWMYLLLAARYARRCEEEGRADLVIELARDALMRIDRPRKKKVLDWMLKPRNLLENRSITRLLVQTSSAQLARVGMEMDKGNLEETARHIRGNDAASRWLIVWLSRTLPALGFLGTVHGIALALMGADALVRAVTPEAQAAAVNVVASNLGIAFTTTFIALIMGIALSWVNDRQSYQERLLVAELERELGYLLDPIGFDPDAVAPPVLTPPGTTGTWQSSKSTTLISIVALALLSSIVLAFVPWLILPLFAAVVLWLWQARRLQHNRERVMTAFEQEFPQIAASLRGKAKA